VAERASYICGFNCKDHSDRTHPTAPTPLAPTPPAQHSTAQHSTAQHSTAQHTYELLRQYVAHLAERPRRLHRLALLNGVGRQREGAAVDLERQVDGGGGDLLGRVAQGGGGGGGGGGGKSAPRGGFAQSLVAAGRHAADAAVPGEALPALNDSARPTRPPPARPPPQGAPVPQKVPRHLLHLDLGGAVPLVAEPQRAQLLGHVRVRVADPKLKAHHEQDGALGQAEGLLEAVDVGLGVGCAGLCRVGGVVEWEVRKEGWVLRTAKPSCCLPSANDGGLAAKFLPRRRTLSCERRGSAGRARS